MRSAVAVLLSGGASATYSQLPAPGIQRSPFPASVGEVVKLLQGTVGFFSRGETSPYSEPAFNQGTLLGGVEEQDLLGGITPGNGEELRIHPGRSRQQYRNLPMFRGARQ